MLSVRVLGDFGWLTSDLIKGIEYAYFEGARIMNMSLQATYSTGQTPAVFSPLRDLMLATPDVLYVAAAGNDYYNGGHDLDSTSGAGKDYYPAELDCPNLLVVGACDGGDKIGYFSNYGSISVDVFAPGVDMIGIAYSNGTLFSLSGTSQATPVAAGIASLVWDYQLSLSATQVRDIVRNFATVAPALSGKCVGAGGNSCTRVNLRASLGGTCP